MAEDKNRLELRLAEALVELAAALDFWEVEISAPGPVLEVMVRKPDRTKITLKIDGSKKHARGHIHLDLGPDKHRASYAIDNGEKLAGEPTKHDDDIRDWILANQGLLQQVFDAVYSGGFPPKGPLKRLRESDYPE